MEQNSASLTEAINRGIKRGAAKLEPINTSGLEPAGRAVLIEPYEPERKGGLIELPPEVSRGLSMVEQRAVVIAVGESAWHDEPLPRAKPGDHVLVTRYAGFNAGPDVTKDGKNYRLVNDRDIFCRVQP